MAASTNIYDNIAPVDAPEIVALRERIAFYEGFHRVIQENVARSADLMQQAADRHAEAERSRAEADAERAEMQRTRFEALDNLQQELDQFRGVLDALTARVASSLAVLTGDGIRSERVRWPALEWPAALPAVDPMADATRADPSVGVNPAQTPEPNVPLVSKSVAPPAAAVSVVTAAVAAGRFALRDGADGNGAVHLPELAPVRTNGASSAEAPPEDDGRPRSLLATLDPAPTAAIAGPAVTTACVIHGVPGVGEARSFEHHLTRQPGLGAVAIREFHHGVLRLDVQGVRPARAADLNSIPGCSDLEEIDSGAGVVIVRFPGAPL